MSDDNTDRGINIFKPQAGLMRGEVRVIVLVMSAWLLAVVGSQLAIWFLEDSLSGFWLTELFFFNLPIHFWLTGQFLPLWFILLGVVFNLWMDRHESRRMDGTIRLRTTGRRKEEQQP
ncbi:MAG: DUF4212 domain-containing protein [Trichlorobacter sp.]|jgi:uncharacterized membrane protein